MVSSVSDGRTTVSANTKSSPVTNNGAAVLVASISEWGSEDKSRGNDGAAAVVVAEAEAEAEAEGGARLLSSDDTAAAPATGAATGNVAGEAAGGDDGESVHPSANGETKSKGFSAAAVAVVVVVVVGGGGVVCRRSAR